MIDKRLLKEIPEAKKEVWKQVFMQWISLLCNIGFVMLLANALVQIFYKQLVVKDLIFLCFFISILLAVRIFTTKRASVYSHRASCHVKNHLRTRLYGKLLLMKNTYQEHISTSELVQLNVEGVDQLETYFGRYLPQFFYSMLAPLTLFLLLVWMDVKSALVLLICVPLIPLSIIAIQKIAKRLLSKYWNSYASLGDSFLENLQGLTTLKIYQADGYKNKTMNEEAENFRKITMKVLTMQLNSVSVMDLIAYGGAAIGSIIAIYGFAQGTLNLFGVICIVLLSSEFFIPLRLLGSFFHIAMNGIAASSKIFRILDLPIDTKGTLQFHEKPIHIQFNNVKFSYEKNRDILNEISMNIKAKQFIGIVGTSGSGKSTLAKLLMGYFKHYEGSISVQSKERKDIDDSSFYKDVMYVTHNPLILKGSVRSNLLLAKEFASDKDCWNVLEKTRLKDFVLQQGGLDMPLLENGSNLSGGQKQRIALARAMLADREVYIFDECTSNIDVESEEAIVEGITSLANKKTIIMITHRLHNIVNSDYIYVLQEGTCIEEGDHSALMKNEKHYYSMYKKQSELEQLKGGLNYA